MKRKAMAAAIVIFVGVGVTWPLVARHGSQVPTSFDTVQHVLTGVDRHLPQVGTCLDGGGDPAHIAKCISGQLPALPGLGGTSLGGTGLGGTGLIPAATPSATAPGALLT